MDALPIDPLLPELTERLGREGRLVLEAPPGAGKTTRVPAALLDAGLVDGRILVLEPRRLAARMAARRVAGERGGRVGGEVGYEVRFDASVGRATRIVYQTEGLFTRRLLDEPELRGVGCVVLDEVHERHLDTDLALALVGRLGERRPDLRIVAMSATLEAAPLAARLGDAPVLRSEGRLHDVAIEHEETSDDRPLEVRVRAAVRRLVKDGLDGHVLVFLPGAAEIRRAADALEELSAHAGLSVCMLHGEMPAAEQDRVLGPSSKPKVILSTNVAESSITIDGVVAVIDSGLARVASHSPWSGLPSLSTRAVSQASATQRAGRAGRTRPGRCLRLYTKHDLASRPAHDVPELLRADLAGLVLALSGMGIEAPGSLPWLDAPPEAALDHARALLDRLGATDAGGRLTDTGRQMLRYPVHPRQARLLVEAARLGAFDLACTAAAILGERDLVRRGPGRGRREAKVSGPSDLLDRIDRFEAAGPRSRDLDPGAVRAVDRARRQLARKRPKDAATELDGDAAEDALALSLLAAWPDRIARRRRPGRPELLLADGGEVELASESVVTTEDLLVCVDATERPGGGALVRLASAIRPEWLLDLFPDRIEEVVEAEWNAEKGRVDAFSRMKLGHVVLAETRERAADHPEAARLLAAEALRAGVHAYADPERLETLAGRLALAASVDPDGGFFELDDDAIRAALERMCLGRTRLTELKQADLVRAILDGLDGRARAALDRLAPEHIALPGRRRAPVGYPKDAPPFVASRIQDFFGLAETPRIGGGRVPLQVRLLGPNGRPVQITQDLAGFWTRHYPEVRRELSRRYPKHKWPEVPSPAGAGKR